MQVMKANTFGIFGVVCAALFAALLGIKAGWFDALTPPADTVALGTASAATARDVWIDIRQAGRKIGFGHETLIPTDTGLELSQRIQMRLNTLGLVQEIRMQTTASLKADYSLKSFHFGLQSGSFSTRIEGTAKVEGLQLATTTADGETLRSFLPMKMPLYLPAGIPAALGGTSSSPGDEIRYPFFDPATLGQATLLARYVGPETIQLGGQERSASHWRLSVKGAAQSIWLSPEGELLKEEGILGITLERTTRDQALRPAESDRIGDLIQLVAITPDRPVDAPESRRRLRVAILGLPPAYPSLTGGRQSWDGRRLSIVREDGKDAAASAVAANAVAANAVAANAVAASAVAASAAAGRDSVVDPGPQAADLAPAPLIESDHAKIRRLAKTLAAPGDDARTKVRRIMDWMAAHIERRPVVSVPSALATLEQRRGDCNEHAVLFAALARAMGIPAQVEAGIVYLKGRFYYHAWNRVYLDKWVTVDALFGQLPADVTHIRLARGSTADQLNLLGVLGRLKIKVLNGQAEKNDDQTRASQ